MNKLKIFLFLAKTWLIAAGLLSGIFTGGLYAMHLYTDAPNFSIINVHSTMAMFACGAFTGACTMVPKMMSNPQIKNPRGYLVLSLLPMSLFQKYVIILLSGLYMSLSLLIFSLPVEMIGNILTTNYFPEREIEIGGVIRYFAQNGIFPLALAEMSVGIFCGTIFKKFYGMYITIIPICFFNSFYFAYGKPMYVPMTESIICIFVTIVFLILGYQVFKRWQIANDGVLMT